MSASRTRGAIFGALVALAVVGGVALASDSSITLNAGSGGPKADTEQLSTGAGTVQRGRTELAGSGAAEVARVLNGDPAGTEYGLVTRNVPSGTQAVSGTFWQATQPISASSLPLPSGAATSAKQPALGVPGTASADVVTVQGIASMTALKVDGSGVTQPVSGSVSVSNFPGTQAVSGTVTVQQATAASLTATVTQGPAGATAWKVDGSAVTQPVSGTLTCNAGSGTLAVSGTVTANAGSGTFSNQQSNITTDYDTGAGTQTMTMFGVALPASGGAVAGGTATNPLRTDPTGTTTQPVSGTVGVSNFPASQAVTESGTWTVQPGNTANTTPWLESISQGGNTATVTAGGALKVDGSAATQPVSGTLTCNVGSSGSLALDATLTGGTAQTKITDGTNIATVKATSTAAAATDKALVVAVSPNNSVAVTGTFFQATQPVSGTVTATQGTAAAASGAWTAKVTDGTNTAAVKAASAAAAAADPSLVCALSPNSPLPTGANTIGTVTAAQATAANLNATVVQATAANLNAQVVGVAANNASPVGNPLLDGAVAQADAANPTALTGGNLGYMRQDTQGRLFVRNFGSNLFTCSVTTTATAVATIAGCLSPGVGLARYITDVYVGGGVATGATAAATITTGTGTTCGTGTATLFRCDHSATGNCITDQTTPIKAGVASDLCFTDAATGTKNVTITGYIAP